MGASWENRQRRGAVAVICQHRRLLVIRRSEHVEAPGTYCFPGGAIEPGESPQDAVRRELWEELHVSVRPRRKLWDSVTSWHVSLSWWLTQLEDTQPLQPNPAEVASVHWLTPEQMRQLPRLLESNRQFLDAWQQGAFQLWESFEWDGGEL
jgi:8-oxo-dGTP diphosphatase